MTAILWLLKSMSEHAIIVIILKTSVKFCTFLKQFIRANYIKHDF